MILAYILAFAVLGSVGSLAGGILLLSRQELMKKISLALVSFSAGTLLGASFFDLLPEAFDKGLKLADLFFFVLIGLILFYLLEKLLIWRHCHDTEKCDIHSYSSMVLFGDALHNFIDGIIIAVSFLVAVPLGFITSIAVILHEIPQEIGDFAVLLHAGWKRKKIISFNLLTSLATIIGALLTYYFYSFIAFLSLPLLGFAAGGFLYIALADLVPETHKELSPPKILLQIILLLAGLAIVWLATRSLAG